MINWRRDKHFFRSNVALLIVVLGLGLARDWYKPEYYELLTAGIISAIYMIVALFITFALEKRWIVAISTFPAAAFFPWIHYCMAVAKNNPLYPHMLPWWQNAWILYGVEGALILLAVKVWKMSEA